MDSCSPLSLVQILSAVYCKGGLPYSFTNLRTLEIHTSLSKREIPGILCLLRKSPVLDTLKFQIFHGKEDNVSIRHHLIRCVSCFFESLSTFLFIFRWKNPQLWLLVDLISKLPPPLPHLTWSWFSFIPTTICSCNAPSDRKHDSFGQLGYAKEQYWESKAEA